MSTTRPRTVPAILRAAAQRIRERGFCAEFGTPEGPCCFIGSMMYVMGLVGMLTDRERSLAAYWDAVLLVRQNLWAAKRDAGAGCIQKMLNRGEITPQSAADFLDDLAVWR